MPPEALERRIAARVERMLSDGLRGEAAALERRFGSLSCTARQAIGYAEMLAVERGDMTLAEARERMIVRTRQLAKKQRTWFRRQARVCWIDIDGEEKIAEIAARGREVWGKYGPTRIVCDGRRER